LPAVVQQKALQELAQLFAQVLRELHGAGRSVAAQNEASGLDEKGVANE